MVTNLVCLQLQAIGIKDTLALFLPRSSQQPTESLISDIVACRE